MIDEKNVVILSFSSRSSVFALHEALKKSGMDSRIISTPAVAKMACGLSVEVDGKDFQKAKSLALQDFAPSYDMIGNARFGTTN